MDNFLAIASEKLALFPGIIAAFFIIFIIHELGHYWAARLCKMKIETFSIGVGRRLYGITDKHGTEWIFRIFPLGGHVQITDLTLDEGKKSRRSVWTRLFVVFAGPGANLLLPFIVLPLCFMLVGLPIRPPVISAVEKGMPAAEVGIKRYDIITHYNGREIISYDEFADYIDNVKGEDEDITLTIERDGIAKDITLTPKYKNYTDIANIDRKEFRIGVMNALLPVYFKVITHIDRIVIEDMEEDERRTLLKQYLGQELELGIKGADDKTHYYNVFLSEDLNQQLFDEDEKYSDAIFLGPFKDNKFIELDPLQSIKTGIQEAGDLFWHMVRIPLQIFPIDYKLVGERIPFTYETPYFYEYMVYRAAHSAALLSILIAFINLIPFPRLDGDFILTYLMESYLGKKPSRRQRAIGIAVSLFGIYCIFMFANLGDIPGYIELKMEDWQERMEKWRE